MYQTKRRSFAANLLPNGKGEMSDCGWEVEVAKVGTERLGESEA